MNSEGKHTYSEGTSRSMELPSIACYYREIITTVSLWRENKPQGGRGKVSEMKWRLR